MTGLLHLQTLARLTVVAFAAWLLSLPLTLTAGSLGAITGVAAAFALLHWGKATQRAQHPLTAFIPTLRLPAVLLASLLISLPGIGLAGLLRSGPVANALLAWGAQPFFLYGCGEFIAAGCLAVSLALLLGVARQRGSLGKVLEVCFVAAALALTLAAHRNGMIDRPFLLGDYALIRDLDPAKLLMGFGVAALLLIAALNLQEKSRRRGAYHLACIAAACLLLLVYIQRVGMPTPQLSNELGLAGSAANGAAEENPFQDSSNDPEDKTAPVAVVVFHDDYEPIDGAYYFRESAYSQFNGTRIDYASRSDMDTDLIDGYGGGREASLAEVLAPDDSTPRQRVRTTIGTLTPHKSLFALDTPIAYSATANPNAARFDSTYEAESAVPTFDFETLLGRSTGARAWSEEVRAEYLRLPADPRYRDLALSLTSRLKPEFSEDPFAQAWVIKQYLDENGIYSLKNAHAAEVDPAASFLFGDLTGYCVHFAFSAVYLYRSLGIPARVGVGYSVPASNRGGGSSLLIQAIHGHAWPEIYFRDIGWVIVDPAPQQTLVDMSTDPQDNLQQMLGDMLRDDASFDEYRRLRSEEGFDWLGMSKRLLNWLGLGVGLAIIAGYVAKFCRRIAPRFAAPAARHRASYRAAADRLADLNIRRRFGESRESFAQRCAALSPQFSHLTQLHLEASFGSASSVSAQEFTQLDQRIQQELRGNVSPWRRLFGALHPFNWLAVR